MGLAGLVTLLVVLSQGGVPDSIGKLKSHDWKVRSEGFREVAELPARERPQAVRLALIGALERENALLVTGIELDESYSGYYAALIQAVAGLKDPRAARALLGALGAGTAASDGLVALGQPAVEAALERLRVTESRRVRRDTCNLLRRMAEADISLNEPAREQMTAAIGTCGR